MSVIEESILPQKFEIITVRIASILADELANQLTLNPTDLVLGAKVHLQRSVPMNIVEYPAVVVSYVSSNYNVISQGEAKGDITYFVDVYNSAKYTETSSGDTVSNEGNQRLLGVIRSILSNPYYVTLGFVVIDGENFIGKSLVRSITMSEIANNKDTESVSFGRLQLDVTATEITGQISPTVLNNYVTEARLFNTDIGLRYEQVKN